MCMPLVLREAASGKSLMEADNIAKNIKSTLYLPSVTLVSIRAEGWPQQNDN